MINKLSATFIFLVLVISGCTSTQLSTAIKSVDDLLGGGDELTSADVVAGLKEALIVGADLSTKASSSVDGYFGNPEIKIPFPPEIEEVELKLRQLGLNKPVDDFVLSINRAAEKAAAEAKPLFVDAITSMSIEDAWGILRGDEHAATDYLRSATSAELENRFRPIINSALESVNATKYYTDITSRYNQLPFVKEVETDLSQYVLGEAIDGLFYLVAREEEKIRKDPVARTTDLLKKVFSEQ